MARTIIGETKRKGQRKAKRCTTRRNQKQFKKKRKNKRRKLIPLVVGSYLSHNPSNVVACKS